MKKGNLTFIARIRIMKEEQWLQRLGIALIHLQSYSKESKITDEDCVYYIK
jgi:hypothetical protein